MMVLMILLALIETFEIPLLPTILRFCSDTQFIHSKGSDRYRLPDYFLIHFNLFGKNFMHHMYGLGFLWVFSYLGICKLC